MNTLNTSQIEILKPQTASAGPDSRTSEDTHGSVIVFRREAEGHVWYDSTADIARLESLCLSVG